MQENANFLPNLTVREAMEFSIKFKFGQLSSEKCASILERLNIAHTIEQRIGDLSSGEQKRLSIALEIVDEPQVIFLDEPTTGLDSSSSTQCIKLLKKLATEGKTIVCTIHQPSRTILKMFDHIYVMNEGYCIYQGSYENLIKFLEENNLKCPSTYNPVDYLLEISNFQFNFLVDSIRNGQNDQFRENNHKSQPQLGMIDYNYNDDPKSCKTPSFLYRLGQLINRTMLLMIRDKSNVIMRVSIHLMVGLLIGLLYSNIGNDANEILNEFKYIFVLNGFCAYSGFYSLMVKSE